MSSPVSRREFLATATATAALAAGLPAAGADKGGTYAIIGFSKPFQSMSPDETAQFVAEVGWDGIECPVRPKGHVEPERADQDLPRMVEALGKRKLVLGIATTGILRADAAAEKLLRTIAKAGIKRYRMGVWKYKLDQPIWPQVKEIGQALRGLAELNKELDLQGGFQNHSGRDFVGAPVWDLHAMLQDMDRLHMGVHFDIGHATVEGGYAWAIHSRLMGPHMAAVYVKDFVWKKLDNGWKAQWGPLGEGMVSREFFKALKKSDFSGPISAHQEYPMGDRAAMLAAMRKDLAVLKGWLT